VAVGASSRLMVSIIWLSDECGASVSGGVSMSVRWSFGSWQCFHPAMMDVS